MYVSMFQIPGTTCDDGDDDTSHLMSFRPTKAEIGPCGELWTYPGVSPCPCVPVSSILDSARETALMRDKKKLTSPPRINLLT